MSKIEKASSMHAPAALAGWFFELFGRFFFVFGPESFQESAHGLTKRLGAGLCRAGVVDSQARAPRSRIIIAMRSAANKCLKPSTTLGILRQTMLPA